MNMILDSTVKVSAPTLVGWRGEMASMTAALMSAHSCTTLGLAARHASTSGWSSDSASPIRSASMALRTPTAP